MRYPEFVLQYRGGEDGDHMILRRDDDGTNDYRRWLRLGGIEAGRRIVRDLNYANEQRAKAARARKRRAAR